MFLKDLNEKQQQAVTHGDGPLLVLAGAGSGKTTTLVHRIAFLVSKKKISPYHILAVTFTNKAARELRERVLQLLPSSHGQAFRGHLPAMGTFHSVCAQLLRKEIGALGYKTNFLIYDSLDQLALIKTAMNDLQINKDQINPRSIHSMISSAKNELISPPKYSEYASEFLEQTAARIYERYQVLLKENNALDFDDLIMKTVELFERFPEVLKTYQKRFKHVLVDEYQDTNHAQYILIRHVANAHKNLSVVGDDWQSIYGWRGARVQNILDFKKDYPQATVIKLEQNYRSTQNILDVSHSVIVKNKLQKKKKLWTHQKSGNKIVITEVLDERTEARSIINHISQFRNKDTSLALRDFVILYRTNAQSRAIEEAFLQKQIPYRIIGGLKFYERKEIKDVLAYLRVLFSFDDYFSFIRIVNEPKRGIGKISLERLKHVALSRKIDIIQACSQVDSLSGLQESRIRELHDFASLILSTKARLHEEHLTRIIDIILEHSGYKDAIKDGSEEGEMRWENIQELKTVASKYDGISGDQALGEFLEEISLMTDIDGLKDEDADAVILMTLHLAKGLEFPCVFIAGLEEGLLPHSRSLDSQNELEEERRLCYVGLTRAKKYLFLSYAVSRTIFGQPTGSVVSRFIEDIEHDVPQLIEKQELSIPIEGIIGKTIHQRTLRQHQPLGEFHVQNANNQYERILDADTMNSLGSKSHTHTQEALATITLTKGDRVSHGTFGKGTVLNVDDNIVDVKFDTFGLKKLDCDFAMLKLVNK